MDMVYVPLTTYDSDMKHLVVRPLLKEKFFVTEANLMSSDNLADHSLDIIADCAHGHIYII